MKKFTFLLLIICLGLVHTASAQKKKKNTDSETTEIKSKSKKKSGKHQSWDAGIMGGAVLYNGDTHCVPIWYKAVKPGAGFYARYSFSDAFAARVNLQFGQMIGDDANYDTAERTARGFSFQNSFFDFAAVGEWEPFGRYRYGKFGKFNRMLSPYVSLGAGAMYANRKVDFNDALTTGDSSLIFIDKSVTSKIIAFIPATVGIRYDLNKSWMLGLEGGFRIPITNADYLDGISESANPTKNDWYEVANLTVGYRFPFKRDGDKDGIPDDEDPCPDAAGSRSTKGCPDQDGDGINDKLDACPEVPGLAKFAGCADTDGDGIPDSTDKCPQEKGTDFTGGCPDSDEDGIVDADDKCPTEKGTSEEQGCPVKDADKDGVADKEDKCPEAAGLAANEGCPVVDSSKVNNNAVAAEGTLSQPTIGSVNNGTITTAPIGAIPTTTAGYSSQYTNSTGTFTDKNASGTTRDLSQLPVSEVVVLNESGNVTNGSSYRKTNTKKKSKSSSKKSATKKTTQKSTYSDGVTSELAYTAPVSTTAYQGEVLGNVTSEDLATLKESVNSIQFETGNAMLKKESYATLSKIASLMQKYPTYILRVTGHTDNTGNGDLDNVKLSVKRARAVYNYFLKKGIPTEQLSYRGCGDGEPVAGNDNEDGRFQNRRVAFDMLNR